MAAHRSHRAVWIAGTAALLILAVWLAQPPQGNTVQPVEPKAMGKPAKLYYGVLACSNGGCHDNRNAPHQKDILLCDYDEFRKWSKDDKHKDAFKVLLGERGRQMARLLGKDVAKDPSCLHCHSVVEEKPFVHDESFDRSEGVTCGACHGFYRDWVGPHSAFLDRKRWRGLSREVKEKQFGMRDLWDPEKRANLCVSCHIGNAKEGKVVTHEMYAVGHPPLPSFEVATFSDAMPRHWTYLSEKSEPVKKILEYDPVKSGRERAQMVVVSALVSYRATMHLLADLADADAKEPGKTWPELAQFDCYACHHDLKAASWRQKRGYTGKPGRPTMHAWANALLPLALAQAGKAGSEQEAKLRSELNANMKTLTEAFDAQPFGEAPRVAFAARQAASWADRMLMNLQTTPIDAADAKNLLQELGKESKARLLDFDSARQFAWAFRVIQDEANPEAPLNWSAKNVEFKGLNAYLQLDLPKGQVEIVRSSLQEMLEKLNHYEADHFQKTFDRMVQENQ